MTTRRNSAQEGFANYGKTTWIRQTATYVLTSYFLRTTFGHCPDFYQV